MQGHTISRHGVVPVRNGIVFLTGYGVKVAVSQRHLAVSDGVGRQRRQGRFAKAPSRIKRLIVLAETGFVSFEALRWLREIKAAFIHLDHEAAIITASVPGIDDARLRRAQSLIPMSDHRLAIARELLGPKVKGQLAVLESFGLNGTDEVRRAIQLFERADDLRLALIAEAKAAEAYWESWRSVEVMFARRDNVPDHWRRFDNRRSPLTSRPRNAADPLNAIENYLYSLLEVEARIALISHGLDPGLALFHADEPNRQSLAADVMEPVRPHIDAFVLDLARKRTFSSKDFVETPDGACRLASSLTSDFIQTMPTWARLVAPYAEGLAKHVTRLAKSELRMIAPIGPLPRMGGKALQSKAPTLITVQAAPQASSSLPVSIVKNACRECGTKLEIRKRLFCDACLPQRRAEVHQTTAALFAAGGPAKIAAMRAAGHDPTNTSHARSRRAKSASVQRQLAVSWQNDGSLDKIFFQRDILAKLQGISISAIANSMGTSPSHASKVRNGHLIPHKRHWNALKELIESSGLTDNEKI